jgi:hypothetical protein
MRGSGVSAPDAWLPTRIRARTVSRSARSGSLVQSGEVRVEARKEVSASTTRGSSASAGGAHHDESPPLVLESNACAAGAVQLVEFRDVLLG